MAPAWEDLDDFLDTDDFAVVGVIQYKAGGTGSAKGHFDDPYLNAALGEHERDTVRPQFMCKMVDVSAVKRGDTITIEGKVYDILTGAHGDGTGMATLELAPR